MELINLHSPLELRVNQRHIRSRAGRQRAGINSKQTRGLDGIHRDQSGDIDRTMFVHEKIDEKAEFGFQSDHTEWRKVELYFLFKIRVRSMVGTQNRQGAIRNSLQ